jgi:hypothetical protein
MARGLFGLSPRGYQRRGKRLPSHLTAPPAQLERRAGTAGASSARHTLECSMGIRVQEDALLAPQYRERRPVFFAMTRLTPEVGREDESGAPPTCEQQHDIATASLVPSSVASRRTPGGRGAKSPLPPLAVQRHQKGVAPPLTGGKSYHPVHTHGFSGSHRRRFEGNPRVTLACVLGGNPRERPRTTGKGKLLPRIDSQQILG